MQVNWDAIDRKTGETIKITEIDGNKTIGELKKEWCDKDYVLVNRGNKNEAE